MLTERRSLAQLAQLQPMVMRRYPLDGRSKVPKEVEVGLSQARPVPELDTELERAARLAQKVRLVDTQQPIQDLDHRHGGLTHTDDPDLLRLDQLNGDIRRLQKAREHRRRHPARSASPDNDDLANAVRRHWVVKTR